MFFKEGGIPASFLTMASTTMTTVNVGAAIFSSRVVDQWGRRKLLLVGSFCQAMAMLILAICVLPAVARYFSPVALGLVTVIAFSLFVVSFSAGLGAITWLYLSEIYPMGIRGAALSACGVVNWVSSFTVVFGGRFLTLHQSVKVFGLITTVGALGIFIWVVETKGCSMEDSPLTPRSGRSNCSLLSPTSPDYQALHHDEDSDEEPPSPLRR